MKLKIKHGEYELEVEGNDQAVCEAHISFWKTVKKWERRKKFIQKHRRFPKP